MKTWLVTGGAGFIGSNFVRYVLKTDAVRVVNLDALTYAGNMASLSEVLRDLKHIFVKGDIADKSLVKELLKQYKPCTVINFAAESHVDRSIEGPAEFIQTNIVGAFELLEEVNTYWHGLGTAEKESFRFLQVSTDEVYGSLGSTGCFSENTPYAPNSPYAASKAAADHLVRAYNHTYGLPTLTTNCSNNFGPYQYPEKLIPLVVMKALEGQPLPVYGDGKNIRDWLYVIDHCSALHSVIELGKIGQTYNIGGNNELTNLEVVQALCDLLDEMSPRNDGGSYRQQITFVKDRLGHDLRYAIDSAKIQTELGWKPVESFTSGLRKTIQWYLDHRKWCNSVCEES